MAGHGGNEAVSRHDRLETAVENASTEDDAFFISLYKNSQHVLMYNAPELARFNKRFFTLTEYPDHGGQQGESNGPEVWQQVASAQGISMTQPGTQNSFIPAGGKPWILSLIHISEPTRPY